MATEVTDGTRCNDYSTDICVQGQGKVTAFKYYYYMPSTFYIVKLLLALCNIFNWTESIMVQSHDDAKHPYLGLNMDFSHCLIVMTYKNCALFRLELG